MKVLLCTLFFLGTLWAEIRIPEPWNPGWFDVLGKNPSRKASGFRLGLVWTEPMEGVEYEAFGIFSEWGNLRYRLGASFTSSFLDSLYRSENFGIESSFAISSFRIGAGGNLDIQVVPGEATWWRAVGRAGVSWNGSSRFSCGLWGSLPTDFESGSFAGNVLWLSSEKFRSEAAVLYQRPIGFLVVLGEKFRLGVLELQGSVAYPGPKVGVGIIFGFQNWGAAFGMHRDGAYMNSRMGGLFYRNSPGTYDMKSKF